MLESLFDNVRNRLFNKKRLQHKSFPVNLWKILNTPVATFIVILNTGASLVKLKQIIATILIILFLFSNFNIATIFTVYCFYSYLHQSILTRFINFFVKFNLPKVLITQTYFANGNCSVQCLKVLIQT